MRIPRLPALALVPLVLALPSTGCGGGGGSSVSGSSGTGASLSCPLPTPLAAPRFTTDILPALQTSCGSGSISCHGNVNPPPGHIRYDTSNGRTAQNVWDELMLPPASSPAGYFRVKPGDVSKSWIIEKVTSNSPGGGGFGTRMPQASDNLCQATVDNLKAWIQAGAPF